jgi:hypothetical protein
MAIVILNASLMRAQRQAYEKCNVKVRKLDMLRNYACAPRFKQQEGDAFTLMIIQYFPRSIETILHSISEATKILEAGINRGISRIKRP